MTETLRLKAALQSYLAHEGRVERFAVMADGHAGLTFGFTLERSDGSSLDCILKKAPEGVPRGGSTDIFRQARLLQELSDTGFPAPGILWASDRDDPLGSPFIIMTRLPGHSVIAWAPSPGSMAQFSNPSTMWTEAAILMGRLHAVDWNARLGDWERPSDLDREVDRWTRLLRHTKDPDHLRSAQNLATRLQGDIPPVTRIGLVHGDLQPGNVLYQNGRAVGLIDWDLAAIGPPGMDVGWLLMIADPLGWAPDWRPLAAPDSRVLIRAYAEAAGSLPDRLDWHQSFACLRMAAITGLNLKLHRDGRRHDPIWERFATAVPFMLGRGLKLLQEETAN